MELRALPGHEIVEAGLADLRGNRLTIEALLVLVGRPRLLRLGLDVPDIDVDAPEHRLYELLAAQDPDAAHARYNALIRRLVSFERAAECVS